MLADKTVKKGGWMIDQSRWKNNYSRSGFLMPPNPFTTFNIKVKYYQNESKFKAIYSRNNLPKIKYGAHVTSLDKYESIGINCKNLYVNGDNVTYFDSIGVEYIPKEIKNFIGNKSISTNIFVTQSNDSIICE